MPDPWSRAAAARGARKVERGKVDAVRESVPTREQPVMIQWDHLRHCWTGVQRAPVTLYSQNRTRLPNPEKEQHMVSAHGHSELTKLGETVCQANRALVWGSEKQARKDF